MIRTTFLFCLIIIVVYFANQGDVVSTVDTVDIEGEFNLSDEKLITERAKLFIGKNIYNIDLRHYKNEFEKIPWIKYSQISINPPSNLTVKIIEHNPMFLWNEQIYVNSEMQTFTTPNLPIKNILRLASNNYSYVEMYNLFKSLQSFLSDINEIVIALSKQDDMLEIKSENLSFVVRHSRYREKIKEFVSIYPNFKSKLNKRKKIHIDLRYPTGFAVR